MSALSRKSVRKAKLRNAPGLGADLYWFCTRCKTRYGGLFMTNPGGNCPICDTILLDLRTPNDHDHRAR